MRQETAIAVLVFLALFATAVGLFTHFERAYEFDFYSGGGGEYAMAQFQCTNGKEDTPLAPSAGRAVFEVGRKLATAAGASANSDRKDLLSWRTRRNAQMRRRPRATDAAPFDALRPAYDAMCQAVEQLEESGECFRAVDEASAATTAAPAAANANAGKQGDAAEGQGKKANAGAQAATPGRDLSKFPKWAAAVHRQMRLWSPSRGALLQRPTLLCVSLVDRDEPARVQQALLQWKLWGRNCDDFYVAVQLPEAGPTVVHNATTDRLVLRTKYMAAFRAAGLHLSHLWAMRPLVSWKTQDYIAADRWQAFRELSRVMGEEDLNAPVYQAEYTLFVRDNTYVVPENVYAFLSSPEVRHLENIGAPAILGHVLQVPPPSPEEAAEAAESGGETIMGAEDNAAAGGVAAGGAVAADPLQKAPQQAAADGKKGASSASASEPNVERRLFASIDGGLLWNRVTRKLFMNAIRSQDACAYANTEADDVVLADCFRFYGVQPFDTADQRGSDRQHILPPEFAMKIGHDPHLVEWYSLYRGRPSLRGVDAIAPTSMTFGGLRSAEEMQILHDVLSSE